MRTAARRGRGRRIAPATVWSAIGAAVLVHAAIIGSVGGAGLVGWAQDAAAHSKMAATEDVDLKSGCIGDAILGSTARYSLCFAPWRSDTDACLTAAQLDMYIDLSACQMQRNP